MLAKERLVNTYIKQALRPVCDPSIHLRHGLGLIHNADNEKTNIKCALYSPFIPFAFAP